MMLNIPTDMLRTLVAVVDNKSFTKAAASLGVTQPAVSAQIKRLQIVLGTEIFAKDAAGIVLTASGDAVVTYARRMLSINDQIVKMVSSEPSADIVRIGLSGDFLSKGLVEGLAAFHGRWPTTTFRLVHGHGPDLLQKLRAGDLDVTVTSSLDKPESDAWLHWTEEMVWVRGSAMPEPVPETVPLIVRDNDHSMSNILLTAALEKIGRPYELVVTASLMHAVTDATDAGMGLTAYAKRRIGATGLVICRDKSLPPLADLTCSLCVRESAESKMLDDLVGMIARIVSPEDSVVLAKKLQVARPPR